MRSNNQTIPHPFLLKRLHSLAGFWLVLFLIEHLFVNSQAALFLGDNGIGFIKAANALKQLPYLPVIETVALGLPFLVHGIWGIKYALTAKLNSFSSDGSKPSLPRYPRNQAFSWQRITSWILLVGVIAHVVQMRFIERPIAISEAPAPLYSIRLDRDPGLEKLSRTLGFRIYNTSPDDSSISRALKTPLKKNEVLAVADNFGTAELLLVRETFKSPLMIALYTLFVSAAVFHGFNGLWTFMISWGITLTQTSQRYMRYAAGGLSALIAFLGLAAIWGTYWINLK